MSVPWLASFAFRRGVWHTDADEAKAPAQVAQAQPFFQLLPALGLENLVEVVGVWVMP